MAIAERDNQIAKIKEQKIRMQINETQYGEKYIEIQKRYRDRILKVINEDNAKKKRITAQTRLKAVEEIEKTNKKIYDYEVKALDASRKLMESEISEKQKLIQNNEYIMEVERINQQQKVFDELLERTSLYYATKIKLAQENAQGTLNIEKLS